MNKIVVRVSRLRADFIVDITFFDGQHWVNGIRLNLNMKYNLLILFENAENYV